MTRLFVPGQEGFEQRDSRTAAVLARVLALDEPEARAALADVVGRFEARHRGLAATFLRHAAEVADRLQAGADVSDERRLLIGATFTAECAVEGAALCNPSMVAHPDQQGVAPGGLRFVLSVRGIGEGHRSTVGFRTGVVSAAGVPGLDPPPAFAETGVVTGAPLQASTFRSELRRRGGDGENADYVLDELGETFTAAELDARIARLEANLATRRRAARSMDVLRSVAARTYAVSFPASTPLAERVLWPSMPAEANGMEDARFVRFTEDDGDTWFGASYTAYDGTSIHQQLLETADFATFTSNPLVGPGAANKGLALFPRRIGGRYAALSRSDRESNAVTFSDDVRHWPRATTCQAPARSWELLQLGNCGPPIETEAGWLVLTHGVGAMRTYRIGAVLLDLADPTVVLAGLPEPLLSPTPEEQDGYVPNVVYSCGSLVHGDTLVLPYGIGDGAIGFATASVNALLGALDAHRVR